MCLYGYSGEPLGNDKDDIDFRGTLRVRKYTSVHDVHHYSIKLKQAINSLGLGTPHRPKKRQRRYA